MNQQVPAPTRGNKAAIVRLIANLQRQNVAKTQCGMRLLAWYEQIAAGLEGP